MRTFRNWKYQVSSEIEELAAKKGTPCAWCHVSALTGQSEHEEIRKTHVMRLDETQNRAAFAGAGN